MLGGRFPGRLAALILLFSTLATNIHSQAAQVRPLQVEIHLRPGWNLLSLPLPLTIPVGASGSFPAGTMLWGWNGAVYEQLSTIPAGAGFWVYARQERTHDLFLEYAQPATPQPGLAVQQGWNLAGPLAPLAAPPANATILGIMQWNQGNYAPAKFPLPCLQGYWLNATEAGKIAFGNQTTDTDGDGMPDFWEDACGLQVSAADANADPDADGFSNLQEFHSGSLPRRHTTAGPVYNWAANGFPSGLEPPTAEVWVAPFLGTENQAVAINDLGMILGTGKDNQNRPRPFVLRAGEPTYLEPHPGFTNLSAEDLNNAGTVVGTAENIADGNTRPIFWDAATGGVRGILPVIAGDAYPSKRKIAVNEDGLIVGNARVVYEFPEEEEDYGDDWGGDIDDGGGGEDGWNDEGDRGGRSRYYAGEDDAYYIPKAYLFANGNLSYLPDNGYGSGIQLINNLGRIFGMMYTNPFDGASSQVSWEATNPAAAGLETPALFVTCGATNAGLLVGTDGDIEEYEWEEYSRETMALYRQPGGAAQILPGLGGIKTGALDVNSRGLIVGQTQLPDGGPKVACLWFGNRLYNLNDYLPPALQGQAWLERAVGVNDRGEIACHGWHASPSEKRIFRFRFPAGWEQGLQVAVTAPSSVISGELLTYTVSITNTAATVAPNLHVSVDIPNGTTFASAQPAATPIPGGISWQTPEIAAGATRQIEFTVRVWRENGHILFNGCTVHAEQLGAPVISYRENTRVLPPPRLVIQPGSLAVSEGSANSAILRLSSAPPEPLTVTVEMLPEGDPDLHLTTPATLIFTPENWQQGQTVTITAAPDGDADDGRATCRVSATGFPDATLNILEQDRDFMVSASAQAGGAVTPSQPVVAAAGQNLELSAQPAVGFAFDCWAGQVPAGQEHENPLVFSVSQSCQLTARFKLADDQDGDGLPDAWEQLHFASTGSDPEDDPDNDGANNAAELAYGTDPQGADPLIGFAGSSMAVAETAGTISISLVRDSNLTPPCSVQVALAGGSATSGADFAFSTPQTVNFSSGQTVRHVQIHLFADTMFEATKTVVLRLLNFQGARPGATTIFVIHMNDALADKDDNDGDGLPDAWEILYFGNLSQTAAGDPDGDGMGNLLEFRLGRRPNAGVRADTTQELRLRVTTPLK